MVVSRSTGDERKKVNKISLLTWIPNSLELEKGDSGVKRNLRSVIVLNTSENHTTSIRKVSRSNGGMNI